MIMPLTAEAITNYDNFEVCWIRLGRMFRITLEN